MIVPRRRAGDGDEARAADRRDPCRARAAAGGQPAACLSAQGEPFTQARAQELALLPGLLLVAGDEGVDERVVRWRSTAGLSVGDYVLSGGNCRRWC
jgi:tRNA (guanine-N1)-methyltransferase